MKHFLIFALQSLLRRKAKNIFIFIVFTFMIFILSCVFIVSNALKNEMFVTLKSLPDITIQRIVAGRQTLIDVNRCEKISKIFGVKKVMPRVWGYYYLPSLGVNFSVVGVESFAKQYNESLNDIVDKYSDKLISGDNMVVGIGVLKMLKKLFFNNYLFFLKPDGTLKKVKVVGAFKAQTALQSNDIILTDNELAREIFGIDENKRLILSLRLQIRKKLLQLQIK